MSCQNRVREEEEEVTEEAGPTASSPLLGDVPFSTKAEAPQAVVPVSLFMRWRSYKWQCSPHHEWRLLTKDPPTPPRAKGSRSWRTDQVRGLSHNITGHPHRSHEKAEKA